MGRAAAARKLAAAAAYGGGGLSVLGASLYGLLRTEAILARKAISEVKRAAKEQGMRFLRESAVERVLDGLTTLREINKVTFVE